MIDSSPSLGNALAAATGRLREAGSPSARLDAELLLAHAIGRDRSWVLAHPEASLDEPGAFETLIGRRSTGEPVAYIRGFKEWRSLRLRTDARALIPRPETELVAEAAIAEVVERLGRDERPIVAWDLATGGGAIALSLSLRFRQAIALERVVLIASDASPDALELAAENLAEHGVAGLVHLALADLLAPAGESLPRPDVLTANLPYVSSAEVDERLGSLGYEPRIALDGGPDGLVLLRRLLEQLPERAAGGATAILELGVGQAATIAELAPRGASTTVIPDLAGLERVVRIQMPPAAT